MLESDDWRLTGQEDYLMGATLFYKNDVDRKTKTDHDHCEFFFTKFSDNYPDTLHAGYTTRDDYRWICSPCFEDFKDMFQFKAGRLDEEAL